ncbi:unnamed protein product [Owenia fusiformis]|uniref:Uncharacterized protein n=1 Tax=Owenia fusiformis TaxID=6347 RepID=A0A8J1TF45_OWEFU|nr:unnamed protein product [Owenia fusiformis]
MLNIKAILGISLFITVLHSLVVVEAMYHNDCMIKCKSTGTSIVKCRVACKIPKDAQVNGICWNACIAELGGSQFKKCMTICILKTGCYWKKWTSWSSCSECIPGRPRLTEPLEMEDLEEEPIELIETRDLHSPLVPIRCDGKKTCTRRRRYSCPFVKFESYEGCKGSDFEEQTQEFPCYYSSIACLFSDY